MSRRARFWVVMAVSLAPAYGLARLSRDWNLLEFYVGMAVLLIVFGVPGMIWSEMARDGAFGRRRSH